MQNLQDIQEKIFFESKNILENLAKINSKEELLSKQELFGELADRISFLRILEKNKENFYIDQNIDNQLSNEIINSENENNYFEDLPLNEEVIEEEVIFTNEINDIDNETEHLIDEHEMTSQPAADSNYITDLAAPSELNSEEDSVDQEDFVINQAFVEEVEIPLVVEQQQADYAERVSQKEREFFETEERRRKIVDFKREEVIQSIDNEVLHKNTEESLTDKKFKLANIKGIKSVQNLFTEEIPEKAEIDLPNQESKNSDSGALRRSNIPTDFMEAPKKHHEFKLDFNDKIAFTKLLFKGNEIELKSTIDQLNSYQNIEEARQYLSEVYYEKDWRKVDEYAQRLWDLVESKF